ncbi:MAG: solute carrier family 26 protein [Saprospiraceae bacterium]|nr:solute carrier family 26 protein [Saprospiraceae bacterium]
MNFIPSLNWIRNYKKGWLTGDISAGLTVGVMLIPQGMAYSMLAGLPPIYGLYAVTIPLLIYAFLGTSRQLAVGPVAMVSLLIASGIGQLSDAGSEIYIIYAITLSLVVGLLQFGMGLFRLGFLVNFLSHPVIAGFTSAAAVIIGISQMKHILGVKTSGEKFLDILSQLYSQIENTHILSLVIGIVSIFLLTLVKKIHKLVPGPLIVVLLGILLVYFGNLDQENVKIVGEIPGGLPSFSLPSFEWSVLKMLFPIGMTIAFVGFMESIAVAKAIQAKHKDYQLDANKELIALGLANIGGALFKAFPVTGGFSRTAVNDQAGAKTGLASAISAFLIIFTLLFLTDYFYYLPNAVLAAIILVAVYGLIDFKEAKHLMHTDKTDFALFMFAAIGTLLLGIEEGILLGVVLSLVILIYRVSYPHYAELGKIGESKDFRNIKRFVEAKTSDETIIFRFDAQVYFANMNYFKDKINEIVSKRQNPKYLIWDAAPVSTIDSSALHMIQDLVQELKMSGITVLISGMIGPVRDSMQKGGIISLVGADHCFLSVSDAWEFATGSGINTKSDLAVRTGIVRN